MTPLYKSKQVQICGDKSQKCLNTRKILFRLRPQRLVVKKRFRYNMLYFL